MSSTPANPLTGLKTGTKITLGGAVVLLIAVFLPWVKASASAAGLGIAKSDSASGWSAYSLGKLTALCALVVIAVILVELYAPQVQLPFPPSLIVLGVAALAVLCVLYHVLFLGYDASVPKELQDTIKFSIGRAWGMFVALIAAGATLYGAYVRLSE